MHFSNKSQTIFHFLSERINVHETRCLQFLSLPDPNYYICISVLRPLDIECKRKCTKKELICVQKKKKIFSNVLKQALELLTESLHAILDFDELYYTLQLGTMYFLFHDNP